MRSKIIIEEAVSVRAIACMCVVMVHSLMMFLTLEQIKTDTVIHLILDTARVLIVFGTPTFVFISALVISYSYSSFLPKGFFKKRIKFIGVPYLSMAVFYALLNEYNNISQLPNEIFFNILGGYHGWFVLVIFQFYVLQKIFLKYIKDKFILLVLLFSLIINVTYLGFFNLNQPFIDVFYVNRFWERGYWILFPGWLFYFSLAFFAGRKYKKFMEFLTKYKTIIVSSVITFATLVVFNNTIAIFESGSKRMDMVFYASSMILLLFLLTSKLKTIPHFITVISNYSLGIYLLHMFWLAVIFKVLELTNFHLGIYTIVLFFIGSITASIVSIYFFNLFPFGKYIVGKVTIKTNTNNKLIKES